MEKANFANVETTREQYINFKNYIKSESEKNHADYVAYYIFKHRIGGEERDKYLDDEVKTRCHKMLFSGRWGSGGDWTDRVAIPSFKNAVINRYNRFAATNEEG